MPAWLWLFIVIAVAICVWLYLGHWTDKRVAANGTPAVPAAGTTAVPDFGTPAGAVVTAGEPGNTWFVDMDTKKAQSLVGRHFDLTDTEVKQVVSDVAFWIGPVAKNPADNKHTPEHRMLVVRDPASGTAHLHVANGEQVTLMGVIEKMPGNPESAWKLDPASADEAGSSRFTCARTG